MKPLLLLDVDGVVNVIGGPERHVVHLPAMTVTVSFPAGIRARLGRLERRYDVVWLTSWGRWAPEHLGPLLGFRWPSAWDPLPGETQEAKVAVANAWAGDERPLAWVDDLSFPAAAPWLAARRAPSLVPTVAPAVGLDETLTGQLEDWATGPEVSGKGGRPARSR